ncbi:hypothetical protein FQN60_014540 [Etheostoma spectabile]|uniref:Uncharacterized protein n=1 Tax=Etheostoma spectabile TaxID=54343 RepID=A0A5J5DCM2_9PERO|nr:hypothetical protein FQN60_014540 [Etheostoma spectabile]
MPLTYIDAWMVHNHEPEALTTIQPSHIKRPAMSNALPRITAAAGPMQHARLLTKYDKVSARTHSGASAVSNTRLDVIHFPKYLSS